jgi:Dolichyl-phosphate-mannose-protein mannosyltransferase
MKKFFPNSLSSWVLYAGLVFLALFIRFYQLGDESFWIDEVFSAVIVEGEFSEIIDRIPKDKPPLDYYFQAFVSPLGVPEFSHRIPAVISGVLAVMGIFAFGSMIGGRRVGMLAMIMAVGNGFFLHYSREARPYMPFAAMLCWQTAFFFLWWRLSQVGRFRKQAWLCLIPILLLSCLMVYTLYAAFIMFGCQILFLLLWALFGLGKGKEVFPRFKVLGGYFGVFGVVLLSVIPLRSRSDLYVSEDFYYRFMGYGLGRFLGILRQSFFFQCPSFLFGTLSIITLVLVLFGIFSCWRFRKQGAVYLFLTGVVANLGILFLYEYINRAFCIRYVIYGVPSLIVMTALFLELLRRGEFLSKSWRKGIVISIVALLPLVGTLLFQQSRPARHGWLQAVQHVCERAMPGDLIVLPGPAEHRVVGYYKRRFKRGDVTIFLSGDSLTPGNSDVWYLTWEGGPDFREKGFNGVMVEKVSRVIPKEPVEEMASQLPEKNVFFPAVAPSTLLGEGWSGKEDWGGDRGVRWGMSNHSTIYFPMTESCGGVFEVRMFGYDFEGAEEQSTTLVLNGQACETIGLPLGGFEVLRWKVSKEQLVEGYNTLEFYFKWFRSPSKDRKNYGDDRALNAAFEYIKWIPEKEEE